MIVTKDTLISEFIYKSGNAMAVLAINGIMPNPSNMAESLEYVAVVHGLDIEELVDTLNTALATVE